MTSRPCGPGAASLPGIRSTGSPPAWRPPRPRSARASATRAALEEGITHEVCSLAGHQELGTLIVLYDDNYISIEDNTTSAKSEDVAARYEAYGWHVQKVDWVGPRGGYHEDVDALYQALLNAKEHTEA